MENFTAKFRYVDPSTGKEISKEEFDIAQSGMDQRAKDMALTEQDRIAKRKRIVAYAANRLELSQEEADILFG